MKLGRFYELVVEYGLENDPRSKAQLKEDLKRVRAKFRKLKGVDKLTYDKEMLKHPYADTRILYGNKNKDIEAIMVGIDMEVGELLLADRLKEKGERIDLVLAHHPEGRALSKFYNVMYMQADILSKFGVRLEPARDLVKQRIQEVARSMSSVNHLRSVDAARILDIPFMCAHTPADNHVAAFLQRLFDRKKPKKVGDILKILKAVPEYKDACAKGAAPYILIGKEEKKTGKIFVDMTGGTEGSRHVFSRLSQAGIGTVVGMHYSEKHYQMAKKEFINVVIAGHVASDTLGLNLLLDNLSRKEEFNIIPCSGFVRVTR